MLLRRNRTGCLRHQRISRESGPEQSRHSAGRRSPFEAIPEAAVAGDRTLGFRGSVSKV